MKHNAITSICIQIPRIPPKWPVYSNNVKNSPKVDHFLYKSVSKIWIITYPDSLVIVLTEQPANSGRTQWTRPFYNIVQQIPVAIMHSMSQINDIEAPKALDV